MLVLFDRLDEVGGIHKRLVRPGIEPGEALSQKLDIEVAMFQVDAVEVGDFQLSARGWLQVLSVFDDAVVVHVQAGHAVVALRLLRFLLDRDGLSFFVEGDNAEALRIIHVIPEDRSPAAGLRVLDGGLHALLQTMPEENVVPEDHRDFVGSDEFLPDDEGLCESVRAGLDRIAQVDAELMSVAEQLAETRCVLRRRDDQNLPDTGRHQDRHRIVDHRLVIDRKQLLRGDHGERIQACAGSAGENDSLHASELLSRTGTCRKNGGFCMTRTDFGGP